MHEYITYREYLIKYSEYNTHTSRVVVYSTRTHVRGGMYSTNTWRAPKALVVLVASRVPRVKLSVCYVLLQADDVLPGVVHALHAAGEGPAGAQVQRGQHLTAVEQFRQRLQTHCCSVQVQFTEKIIIL